nr:prostatic acid phosphatase-like isoform X2 [Condylostylus longicornis]
MLILRKSVILLVILCILCIYTITLESRSINSDEKNTSDSKSNRNGRAFTRFQRNTSRLLNKRSQSKNCANSTHTFESLPVPAGKNLELVHIVFRHGARTPADTYPNDPHINETFKPYGWGQVTNLGKCKLYNTGEWLRTRYNSLLGPYYFPDLVHAQSTGVSRTQMSIQIVLAGLFKPKSTPMEWNKKLNWQPIPVNYEELNKDTLLLVRIPCPRYGENFDEIMNENENIKDLMERSAELYKNLTEITGLEIKTPDDVSSLYSTLKAEKEYGLTLPKWTMDYFPDKMQENAELSYNFNIYTKEMQKIKSGPFIKKMSNEWKAKRDNTLSPSTRKLYIYCGHDSSIVNFLYALGVWKTQFPGYSVMAIFELYSTTEGDYEVRIYQKDEGENPIPLTIPGCTEYCPLDKFLELTADIIPEDGLTEECKAKDPNYVPPPLGGP